MIDERSAKNILTLLPRARSVAERFLEAANEELASSGVVAKIISGSRTYKEQDALYAKGRTAPGPKVTNARGGYSNHNFGIAWDIGLFKGPKYLEESPLYALCGKVGNSLGLEWGGDWKSFKDEPHFQLKTGLSLAELRDRVAKGIPIL